MARRKRGQPVHGWVILDKPLDLNSTKAVAIVRRLFDAQKAGHAGTLDPLATGILPIALGEATKTVPNVMNKSKIYQFTVKWGAETETDDLEGNITATSEKRPSRPDIENALPAFIGWIEQTPPAYSAIKIDGERAYDLARAGEQPEMQPRDVIIHELVLNEEGSEDTATFTVRCGKGTYVRALARDLGRQLGCLGHVVNLRRLATGPFTEKMSISLEKLKELSHSAHAQAALKPALHSVETALDDIPALAVNEMQASRLRLGQSVLVTGAMFEAATEATTIKGPAYAMNGMTLVALGTVSQGSFKPNRVFNL